MNNSPSQPPPPRPPDQQDDVVPGSLEDYWRDMDRLRGRHIERPASSPPPTSPWSGPWWVAQLVESLPSRPLDPAMVERLNAGRAAGLRVLDSMVERVLPDEPVFRSLTDAGFVLGGTLGNMLHRLKADEERRLLVWELAGLINVAGWNARDRRLPRIDSLLDASPGSPIIAVGYASVGVGHEQRAHEHPVLFSIGLRTGPGMPSQWFTLIPRPRPTLIEHGLAAMCDRHRLRRVQFLAAEPLTTEETSPAQYLSGE